MKGKNILFIVSLLVLINGLTFGDEKEKIAVATFDAKGVDLPQNVVHF